MKKLGFIFIFLLSACHPLDAKQQQQDYICQSMIQGYLKMQQLYDFRLWQREKSYSCCMIFDSGSASRILPTRSAISIVQPVSMAC